MSEPVAVSPMPTLAIASPYALPVESPSPFASIAEAKPMPPRKVSRTTPNMANTIADLKLEVGFPELIDPNIWITGSRVWRRVLGEWAEASADIDVFATTTEAYDAVCNALLKRGATITERPPENRSHARGVGCRIEPPPLADGSPGVAFDVWYETGDVFAQLAIFPSDGYAHCRSAYNVARGALVILRNELA